MKKISIVLTLILSAFIISSCAEKNPNDPNTDNSKKITLAERAGNYEGDMGTTKLTIKFDNQCQVTKIMVGALDFSTMGVLPTKVGDPTSTNTEYIFDVAMLGNDGKPSGKVTKVKVNFDSATQATGGKAFIDLTGSGFSGDAIIIKKVS